MLPNDLTQMLLLLFLSALHERIFPQHFGYPAFADRQVIQSVHDGLKVEVERCHGAFLHCANGSLQHSYQALINGIGPDKLFGD